MLDAPITRPAVIQYFQNATRLEPSPQKVCRLTTLICAVVSSVILKFGEQLWLIGQPRFPSHLLTLLCHK